VIDETAITGQCGKAGFKMEPARRMVEYLFVTQAE